ncbi:ABC transporter permease [Helcococcus massiliensis]|uniref:ABC transporter permease n=1 Tax=Helcococcus massiliensis TaxID=2040290 RepID=UPI000CDEB992|nr:ABC transporter permease [Helcococcus massiliensis]
MKQFWTVFKFELSQTLKQKSFYITVLLTALILFGASFVPRLMAGKSETGEADVNNPSESSLIQEKEKIALLINGQVDPSVKDALAEIFDFVEVKDESELANKVKSEEVEKGVSLLSNTEAVVYLAQASFYDSEDLEIKSILEDNYRYNIAIRDLDISADNLRNIDQVEVNAGIQSLGTNPFVGYVLSYIMVFFLYFLILARGQSIATSVAKEKDNRTMELLVTSVKPSAMIWGKVMSGLVASIINILAIALGAGLGYLVNVKNNPMAQEIIKSVLAEVSSADILVFLGFTIVGVTFYYLIFAALGSMVSRLDEMNQAMTPVTMMVVIAFMVTMFTMSTPNSPILKIASFVPFTSPLAMFARYQMISVPTVEVLISFAILLVSTIVVAFAATKIYRSGTLNYGNKMNIFKALKKND